MIKVLQVYCEFMPQSSGVARHMDGLADALAVGWDVRSTIFTSTPPQPIAGRNYDITTGGLAALAQAVARCDVVHAHGARTVISAAALRLARLWGKPTVFTPHCYYQGGSWGRRLGKKLWDVCIERSSLVQADAVILLHEGWDVLLRQLGFCPRRIDVIPNCIDAEQVMARLAAVRPMSLPGHPALLSVGRLDKIKRLDDAVRAMSEPGLDLAELHIVGQGNDLDRLTALVDRLNLADRVHFYGWRDDLTTAAMMRGCDAMILASEREGLPTIVLEALLAGVPIAVSAIEGNLAVANAVGWEGRFPLGDSSALARCLTQCLSQPVSPQVADDIIRLFSWQNRAGDVAALYRDLLEAKGAWRHD